MPGKRGRPKGWKMPDHVKKKIAASKTGQTHSIETRNKIAASVIAHYQELESVSKEMLGQYKDKEAKKWLKEMGHLLDGGVVRTEGHIAGMNRMEIQAGDTVKFYGHGCTPLDIVLSFEESSAPTIAEYRATNRNRRNSGKDFCNIV